MKKKFAAIILALTTSGLLNAGNSKTAEFRISRADVKSSQVISKNNTFTVSIMLNPPAASALQKVSNDNAGSPLTFFVDNKPVMTPKVRAPITGDRIEISGLTEAEANDLNKQLKQ